MLHIPFVLPQEFSIDMPTSYPLVRTINELRWWAAVISLEDNPDIKNVEASHQRNGWTWRLEQTDEKLVYTRYTYLDGKLMVSTKMNTNIARRNEYIKNLFPRYKQKAD
jgi:hypothetical protein